MGQYDITDASVSNLTCSIPESTFEAGAHYANGNEVAFRYKVTDAASNESGWKEISDTLKIDLIAPKEHNRYNLICWWYYQNFRDSYV